MRCVVDAVLQDVERRDIGFPTTDALRHPVRNTANGSCITPETPRSQTLVHLVLEMILIQPIEWLETSAMLLQELQTNLNLRPTACTLRALFYGPFAPLMMSGLSKKSLRSHIEMLDISHESRDAQMSCNYGESSRDIAIIGIGVDFPNGTDTNQFWGALKNGMNFVQEVSKTPMLLNV
jgi:Beta-ketoacyl synthase, N-terminal domain